MYLFTEVPFRTVARLSSAKGLTSSDLNELRSQQGENALGLAVGVRLVEVRMVEGRMVEGRMVEGRITQGLMVEEHTNKEARLMEGRVVGVHTVSSGRIIKRCLVKHGEGGGGV